jgi:hypothetical protein
MVGSITITSLNSQSSGLGQLPLQPTAKFWRPDVRRAKSRGVFRRLVFKVTTLVYLWPLLLFIPFVKIALPGQMFFFGPTHQ